MYDLRDRSKQILLQTGRLSAGLPETSTRQIAQLVRGMNSYYSNLIEGHHTYPGELDKVQQTDYSKDPKKPFYKKSVLIKKLESAAYVTSDGPKKPLRIAFPADLRDACLPNLFIPA